MDSQAEGTPLTKACGRGVPGDLGVMFAVVFVMSVVLTAA